MQRHDIVPDVHTRSAALRACEKGPQCQPALYLLRAIPHQDVVPVVITRSAAISACEKGQQCQPA